MVESQTLEREPTVRRDAVIRTPIAPMHAEPRVASPMISQQLGGHEVQILEQDGEWFCIRGADEYDGWVHGGFVLRAAEALAAAGQRQTRISLGCVVENALGMRRSLPLRARLAPDETLVWGDAVEEERRFDRYPQSPDAITYSAREFFGSTSYLWGGVTPWGADCSGLVQSVFALHGMQLPRDAWQQAELGAEAGRDVGELRPADLLFFSDRQDRRVTHVGIALGDARMVHLALSRGGYAVEQLSDRGDPVVEMLRKRFLFAKRLL
ncbi:MAG TPA: SH3 domain-containing C40 family peptidase [Gemmatimonadaceae bacterium]|nr:SH3 domain-containing C40 family peptidase [Gemmatimonadaceae bacterium]